MVHQASEAREALELIARCLSGDRQAASQFQHTYGELIYGYPMRVYRTPAEDAGDFYVFAFERGRIFRRLRTFEGRAPLRAYLLGFVLDDLVLEWKRGQHEIDTVSVETLGELPDSEESMNYVSNGEGNVSVAGQVPLAQLLAGIEPSKAVVMKLLYIEDCELTPSEIRYLADVSGRPIAEVLQGVENLRATVREREAGVKREEDALDAVQAWIQLYERRVQRVSADLLALPPEASPTARLQEERRELERKIGRRQRQRAKLLARARRRKVTAPYKEVAALLNTTTGNVGSQIARLRQELSIQLGLRGQVGERHD